MVLVPVALAVTARSASATTALAEEDVAARTVSFGFLGPVGIAAVALGAGGMIAGLVRHHRRREAVTTAAAVGGSVTAPLAAPAPDTRPAPDPVESAGGERVA